MPTARPKHLSATDFTELGRRFAARSLNHEPSWAWVDGAAAGESLFAPPTGYLRASRLLLPPSSTSWASGMVVADDSSAAAVVCADDDQDGEDSSAAPLAEASARLLLCIAHNGTYDVPVLLLQGYHADGSLWTPDVLREYMSAHERHGRAPIPPTALSQIDHPVTRVPCFCVDPCETAALMGHLLSCAAADNACERQGDVFAPALDYLSAWWSVLAPLVGAPSHAAWATDGACCEDELSSAAEKMEEEAVTETSIIP